jgi:hypothetical protein
MTPSPRRIAWYDATFTLGIGILTVGLSLWSIPVAVIVLGLLLCGVSLRAAQHAQHAPTQPSSAHSTEMTHGSTDRAAA